MANESYKEFARWNSDEYDNFLGWDNAIADLESKLGIKLWENVQTLLQQRISLGE